jgi:HEAT repeat protein
LSSKPQNDSETKRFMRRTSSLRSAGPRSRLAGKLERALNTVLGGDHRVVIEVKASELLAEADAVSQVISAALERAGPGLATQLTLTQAFRRSGLDAELIDSLGNPDPAVRRAGARVCGALRMPEAVPWLADLLDDPVPAVQEVAIRALGEAGGRRVVDALMSRVDTLPQYRVAKELARAASDIDLESLLRREGDAKTTVTVLMACGLRGDALRTPLLVRMAQDDECDTEVRVAACRAVAMIGDPAGADAMRTLATDPDEAIRNAAMRARLRISAAVRKRSA